MSFGLGSSEAAVTGFCGAGLAAAGCSLPARLPAAPPPPAMPADTAPEGGALLSGAAAGPELRRPRRGSGSGSKSSGSSSAPAWTARDSPGAARACRRAGQGEPVRGLDTHQPHVWSAQRVGARGGDTAVAPPTRPLTDVEYSSPCARPFTHSPTSITRSLMRELRRAPGGVRTRRRLLHGGDARRGAGRVRVGRGRCDRSAACACPVAIHLDVAQGNVAVWPRLACSTHPLSCAQEPSLHLSPSLPALPRPPLHAAAADGASQRNAAFCYRERCTHHTCPSTPAPSNCQRPTLGCRCTLGPTLTRRSRRAAAAARRRCPRCRPL